MALKFTLRYLVGKVIEQMTGQEIQRKTAQVSQLKSQSLLRDSYHAIRFQNKCLTTKPTLSSSWLLSNKIT